MHTAPTSYLQDSIVPKTQAAFCPFNAPRSCLQTIWSHLGLRNRRALVEPYPGTLDHLMLGIILEAIYRTLDVSIIPAAL